MEKMRLCRFSALLLIFCLKKQENWEYPINCYLTNTSKALILEEYREKMRLCRFRQFNTTLKMMIAFTNKLQRILIYLPVVLLVVFIFGDKVFALEPFVSDGCSRFPNGTVANKNLWLTCCVEHDKAYWRGGSYDERLIADQKLRDCVAETGQPFIGEIMLGGVRAGGSPFFPTDYRWGYGWPYPRGYKALSETELEQVEQILKVGVNE